MSKQIEVIKMEFIVSKEAEELLRGKVNDNEQLLLDVEDGDGPFANSRITCQIDTSFRLIIVEKETSADLSLYSEVVDTQMGPIKIKKSALVYLDNPTTLAVEPTYKSLQLKGPGGIIKNNLQIVTSTI